MCLLIVYTTLRPAVIITYTSLVVECFVLPTMHCFDSIFLLKSYKHTPRVLLSVHIPKYRLVFYVKTKCDY